MLREIVEMDAKAGTNRTLNVKPSHRWRRWFVLALLVFAALIFLNNTNFLATRRTNDITLLAHRGLAQRFDTANLANDTCTASRMIPAGHGYLENTLPSMEAAFRMGADIVEIDVHPTTDGQFAVFHDWTLDCRTEGTGVTREHSMAELKRLDVGYGYTADGGKSFPFRGKGVDLIPSLDEVLSAFPAQGFLINIKSADAAEGERLAAWLSALPPERLERIMVYGAEPAIAPVRERRLPQVRVMSKDSVTSCLLRYATLGWSGYVPHACRGTLLILPLNVTPWLWGWPNVFLNRMEAVGTRVFVQGDYTGGWSRGIDTRHDFERLPEGFSGGVMTDELPVVAPLVQARRRASLP